MEINQTKGKFLTETIEEWYSSGLITDAGRTKLLSSFRIRKFDWKRLAKYSFITAIICIFTGLTALFMDEYILALIRKFFNFTHAVRSFIFTLIAAAIFISGYLRAKRYPSKIFSNEAINFAGVLSLAVSITFLGYAIDTGSGHYSLLILLAAIAYAVIAVMVKSGLIWIFAILSFGSWLGAESGYVSGWGAYFLGMNYPLRFVLFSMIIISMSFLFQKISHLDYFYRNTYKMGLLYLFISLWILSIFGNYGDMTQWYRAKQIELIGWCLLFGAAAAGVFIYGLKTDDMTSRGFGITFMFINLYTRYFEYSWNSMHKAVFFIILGLSFIFIGYKAEKIWNIRLDSHKDNSIKN